MLIVQKYGGSSVANAERMKNVAKRIIAAYDAGHKVVVTLSAQGNTTDDLTKKASELSERPSKREMDVLLATGEQQSVALMAMTIQNMGRPAKSLIAPQIELLTNSEHGNAKIKKINRQRILHELENNNIVIAAGFQGINKKGDITTLGRGGSDTTAVALAAVLRAEVCEIYTDVEGVYTADPRVVRNAKKLPEISYDEMLELATLGAQVLHNRSVELAKKYGVELVVRSSLCDAPGTIVKEVTKMEKMIVNGLAIDKNICSVSIIGIPNTPGKAFRIFSLLANKNICVDIILQSIGRDATKDITVTVRKDDLKETLKALEESKKVLGYESISYDEKIAKLSVVGAGMETNSGVAALMFEALYDANINVNMISTSEIKISVLIDEKDIEAAANYVHDKFLDHHINLP